MGIDGATDLVGAAGSLGRKAFQSVSKSFADDSVGVAEKTFNVLGKGNIA